MNINNLLKKIGTIIPTWEYVEKLEKENEELKMELENLAETVI